MRKHENQIRLIAAPSGGTAPGSPRGGLFAFCGSRTQGILAGSWAFGELTSRGEHRLDTSEYRRRVMEHAQSLSYPPPRAVALSYKGRRRAKSDYIRKEFVFTTVNDREVRISAGDNYYSAENLWRNAKGQLTAGQNTTGKPYRKRRRPPSRTWDEDWQFAASPDLGKPEGDFRRPGDDDSQFSGKWLLFVAWHRVDEA